MRGHPSYFQPPRTLWCSENGVDAVSEDAADAVDVTCGVIGIPGLLAAPARDKKTIFAAIVATEDLGAIASGPMRAAIDFKWLAFGKRRWRLQVCIYIGFAVCYLGGVAGLLLSTTAVAWCAGALLFAMAQLFNLYYAREEWFEAERGLDVYLASPTNWVDVFLILVTMLLVPLLMVQSADALAREVCVACAQTWAGSGVVVVGVSCAHGVVVVGVSCARTGVITLACSAGGRHRHDADLHEDCQGDARQRADGQTAGFRSGCEAVHSLCSHALTQPCPLCKFTFVLLSRRRSWSPCLGKSPSTWPPSCTCKRGCAVHGLCAHAAPP